MDRYNITVAFRVENRTNRLITVARGLLRLHEADEAAVDWLKTYGS